MTYRSVVQQGAIALPPNAHIEDGTAVEITVCPKSSTLGDLLKHAGRWHGDDAEAIVEMIYRTRSSRHPLDES